MRMWWTATGMLANPTRYTKSNIIYTRTSMKYVRDGPFNVNMTQKDYLYTLYIGFNIILCRCWCCCFLCLYSVGARESSAVQNTGSIAQTIIDIFSRRVDRKVRARANRNVCPTQNIALGMDLKTYTIKKVENLNRANICMCSITIFFPFICRPGIFVAR